MNIKPFLLIFHNLDRFWFSSVWTEFLHTYKITHCGNWTELFFKLIWTKPTNLVRFFGFLDLSQTLLIPRMHHLVPLEPFCIVITAIITCMYGYVLIRKIKLNKTIKNYSLEKIFDGRNFNAKKFL